MHHTALLAPFRERYLQALLAGEAGAAAACVSDALAHGIGVVTLYLEVLLPAQGELGERWHRGELNVAEEHRATQITLGQLQRLRLAAPRARATGRRVVVTAVEGERHDLGARVVADLLAMDGWAVDFLGADTPTVDLVALVGERQPDLVLLSVTLSDHLGTAGRAIGELRRLPHPPKVVLGGRGVDQQPREANALGADAVAADAWETVQQARSLVGMLEAPRSLDQLLVHLGQRIQARRRARRWSQQQLGEAAGLHRSYVNAVEQGRQNLTLGAVVKLAAALDEPLDGLLFPSNSGLSGELPS